MQCKQGHFLRYCLLGILAKRSKSWKQNEGHRVKVRDTPTFNSWGVHFDDSLFSVMAGLIVEMLFMLFSVYNTA